ncbi:hypothetical protein [Deinococcus pimensis]|uniref:hypothetical protein n=1 Tax=Deinococcus pimensis TaxID=309888 RepID=UPI0004BB7F5B|nr:hypothetical protein [Deinococcus pimensis]
MNPLDLALLVEDAEREHMRAYAAASDGAVLDEGDVGAVWCGPGMPVNVGFGFGSGAGTASCLPRVEDFLRARGGVPGVTAYTHLHPHLMETLGGRGYRLARVLNVHARSLDGALPEPALPVREATPHEWLGAVVPGFGAGSEGIMAVTSRRPRTRLWICDVDGEAAAAGASEVFGDLALLFSTATRPDLRGRGAQAALLAARLLAARGAGARHAVVMTAPLSASERNMWRAGFTPLTARLSFALGTA